jgi:hypothetical protein
MRKCDLEVWGAVCAGDLLSVAARRKHFQSAAHRTATSFTREHVWTFHLWQVCRIPLLQLFCRVHLPAETS